eukprot:12906189-Prorocentrum_lima.AAC.1
MSAVRLAKAGGNYKYQGLVVALCDNFLGNTTTTTLSAAKGRTHLRLEADDWGLGLAGPRQPGQR